MGNTSRCCLYRPTPAEIKKYNALLDECNANEKNPEVLVKMFKDQWIVLFDKWTNGKMHEHHFYSTDCIVELILDRHLFILYHQLIDKWNNGSIRKQDWNIISMYVNKFL
jgi:hypothetical protein